MNIIWVADPPPSLALIHPYPTRKGDGDLKGRKRKEGGKKKGGPTKTKGLKDADSPSWSASTQQAKGTNQQTNSQELPFLLP